MLARLTDTETVVKQNYAGSHCRYVADDRCWVEIGTVGPMYIRCHKCRVDIGSTSTPGAVVCLTLS